MSDFGNVRPRQAVNLLNEIANYIFHFKHKIYMLATVTEFVVSMKSNSDVITNYCCFLFILPADCTFKCQCGIEEEEIITPTW